MKVAVFSNNGEKFLSGLLNHWRERGHDVKFEVGANPELARKSDVVFVDQYDNNIHYLFEHSRDKGNTKVFARALDWDVWQGLVKDQRIIDWLDGIICIAPHIERKLRSEANMEGKLTLIKPGVDPDKFTFTDKEYFKKEAIIPCNEIDWVLKNVAEGVKIAGMMGWNVTLKGIWTGQSGGEYYREVLKDIASKNGIKLTMVEEHVDDYNEFLETFDYCIQPSYKEAFSYTLAECMLKGIHPIINNWIGCKEIWPNNLIYTSFKDIELMEVGLRRSYRDYVIKNYHIGRMCEEFDQLMGL